MSNTLAKESFDSGVHQHHKLNLNFTDYINNSFNSSTNVEKLKKGKMKEEEQNLSEQYMSLSFRKEKSPMFLKVGKSEFSKGTNSKKTFSRCF